jgi:hypothetical protein
MDDPQCSAPARQLRMVRNDCRLERAPAASGVARRRGRSVGSSRRARRVAVVRWMAREPRRAAALVRLARLRHGSPGHGRLTPSSTVVRCAWAHSVRRMATRDDEVQPPSGDNSREWIPDRYIGAFLASVLAFAAVSAIGARWLIWTALILQLVVMVVLWRAARAWTKRSGGALRSGVRPIRVGWLLRAFVLGFVLVVIPLTALLAAVPG